MPLRLPIGPADSADRCPLGPDRVVWRLLVVLTVSVLLSMFSFEDARAEDAGAEPPDRPNIVLIMADDLGQETLGCYGGRSYQTPHLDRLARTGMRFHHCYSMPVCHPTRLTLMTGRYPFRFPGASWGTFPKSEEKRTIAQVMQNAGYATAVAGKWQLTLLKNDPQQPHRMGFEQYSLFGWHEGPRYHQPLIWQNGTIRQNTEEEYGPRLYTDFLIDFIDENRQKPFFAFYSMALCHAVSDDFDQPVPFIPGKDRYMSYKEMVESMDTQVGRLVEALDDRNLREETLILFTADNGTPSSLITTARDGKLIKEKVFSQQGETVLRGGKGSLTDGGTRVPLIANWKGTIEPGQVVSDLVDVSDFLPTAADLAGASFPDKVALDGHSFAPRLRGQSGASRPWVYAERGGSRYWLRTQDWKLYHDGRLFHVEKDPTEEKPISPSEGSDKAAQARKKLQAAMQQLRPPEK